jgi:murein DD-endopeptidase MepM/ murein hydrolase activator NlpD
LSPFKRLARTLSRHVTVLVIPHSDLPLFRGRFTLSFMLFGLALWSGLTVWAGYLAGRHVDYWVTKTDNAVIRARMNYMAEEMDKSHDLLEMAKATDKQLRIVLGMRSRDEIVSADDEAFGGPNAAERQGLRRLLAGTPLPAPVSIRRTARDIRRESETRLASFQEIAWYITNERSLYHATPNIWPTNGKITSLFGYRFAPFQDHADAHGGQFHEGVDIANRPDTPIVVTADGVVRYAGWSSGYGMMTLVDHGFGYSTLYGHTSKILVKVGDRVARGQMIAYMGTTGRSTGHHLHYEVWRHGRPTNPMRFLRVEAGAE